jgi:hypothetical protein
MIVMGEAFFFFSSWPKPDPAVYFQPRLRSRRHQRDDEAPAKESATKPF